MRMAIKPFFVCDQCRAECKGIPDECGPSICHEIYYPRKQNIGCLGPLCDMPCGLQDPVGDLTREQLIVLVKYLATELDKFLITEA